MPQGSIFRSPSAGARKLLDRLRRRQRHPRPACLHRILVMRQRLRPAVAPLALQTPRQSPARPMRARAVRGLACCEMHARRLSLRSGRVDIRSDRHGHFGIVLDGSRQRRSSRKLSVKKWASGPVFVAKLQHEFGKLVAAKHRLLPGRSGWIVSLQAADRRPLFFWGSTRGGGPRLGWRQPDRKRKPRLKQLGLEV